MLSILDSSEISFKIGSWEDTILIFYVLIKEISLKNVGNETRQRSHSGPS